MINFSRLAAVLILVLLRGSVHQFLAQQISIIPVTNSTASNGAFVRGASNDGKRIVFESTNDYTGENRDRNNEIFVYDVNLQKVIQITKTGGQGGTGGGGVVLSGRKCPGGCEPAGFSPINAAPAISGDGTHIAFASSSGLLTNIPNGDGNVEIYLALLPRNASAATIQRITETEGLKDTFDNNTPSISQDGSVIAFQSTRRFFKSRGVQIFTAQNEDSNAQLFVYEVNTRKMMQVTHKRIDEGIADFDVKGFISNPSLSGNGKVLAFLSGFNFSGNATVNNADLNGEIFIYKVGDPVNQVTQVTSTTDEADVPEDGAVNVLSRFSKHLSDDGSLLVFESTGGVSPVKSGEKIRDVFLYNINTRTMTQMTSQDVGKKDLSDFNYFPSINSAGTFVTFSSKLNLPVMNDAAGNFNNSRELYRYDIARSTTENPKFLLITQTELSEQATDQRQILFAPFISDDGSSIVFSNNGNLLAPRFNSTPEIFQAVLRPMLRESAGRVVLANAASFDRAAIARGSLVAAFGTELASTQAVSNQVDSYPFELNGVSITAGDSLSGIAARIIAVSPSQINFVMPTGLAADDDDNDDDEIPFLINNNGVISRGTFALRDAAPGIFAIRSDGTGPADARCRTLSTDGQETTDTALPCAIGYDGAISSLVLYGTGVRFGSGIRVRFRFIIENNEEDEIEITPTYAGPYIDDNGDEHLGLDQIVVTLDEDLTDKVLADTKIVLTSNREDVTSQDNVTTSFASFEEDMSVINAASQESGPVACGSIALAQPQNDDDEGDTFTDQTLTASSTEPPLELGGVRVKVAGIAARILRVSPEQVRFIIPPGIEEADNVLFQLTNGKKIFNTRVRVQNAAPGVFTTTDDGDGQVAARCGLMLSNGTIEFSPPPCALSTETEQRLLVLTGTGWRFASGVKATFDGTELTPSFAGAEPGLPGVDRLEIPLTADLAEDIAGKEKDLIVTASVNGVSVSSQTGAALAFQEVVNERAPASGRQTAIRQRGDADVRQVIRKARKTTDRTVQ